MVYLSVQEEQEAARRRQQKDNKDCKSNSTTPTKTKELSKVRSSAMLFLLASSPRVEGFHPVVPPPEYSSRTPVGRKSVPDW